MSAEIKGLKTIHHNKDEAFITRGYRNWRHATEDFRVHEESDCHKDYVIQQIMSVNYYHKVLHLGCYSSPRSGSDQLSPPETVCYVDESFNETLICGKARNMQIFLTILRNIQILSRQGLALNEIECKGLP